MFLFSISVTLRNVASILEASCLYEANQLKAACLDLLCVNMETVLESRQVCFLILITEELRLHLTILCGFLFGRLLDGYPSDIIESIEEEMHSKQTEKMPL